MTSGCLPADPFAKRQRVLWHEQELFIGCSLKHGTDQDQGAPAPLILCLHGAYCNRGDFACLLTFPRLEQCSFLLLDLPGHGESSKIPLGDPEAEFPACLEDMADVIVILLGELGLGTKPCIIVGHSLGGAVGLLLSQHLAPNVLGFVSLEGCLVATDTPANGLASRWMQKDPRQVCSLDLLEDIAAAAHLGRDPAGIQHWFNCAESCGVTAHFLSVRMSTSLYTWSNSGKLVDFLDGLPMFHYVYGPSSGKFSTVLQAALSSREHCHSHPVEGSGHFMLLDNASATMDIIADAVEQVLKKDSPISGAMQA